MQAVTLIQLLMVTLCTRRLAVRHSKVELQAHEVALGRSGEALRNDTEGTSHMLGACTPQDLEKLWTLGPGTKEGSFEYFHDKCARSEWSMSGFKEDAYVKCLKGHVDITRACGKCFAGKGSFGFKSCKWPCHRTSCGKKCLECMNRHEEHLVACVGGDYPKCNGDGSTPEEDEPTFHPSKGLAKDSQGDEQPSSQPQTTTTTTAWEQKGSCTKADWELLGAGDLTKLSGNTKGSLAEKAAECGGKCYSWNFKMKEGCFNDCLRSKFPMSESCSGCFLESAKYGLANCKGACMSSWCSEGCLKCTASQQAKVKECVGFQPPVAWACNSSEWGKPNPWPPVPASKENTPTGELSSGESPVESGCAPCPPPVLANSLNSQGATQADSSGWKIPVYCGASLIVGGLGGYILARRKFMADELRSVEWQSS